MDEYDIQKVMMKGGEHLLYLLVAEPEAAKVAYEGMKGYKFSK